MDTIKYISELIEKNGLNYILLINYNLKCWEVRASTKKITNCYEKNNKISYQRETKLLNSFYKKNSLI